MNTTDAKYQQLLEIAKQHAKVVFINSGEIPGAGKGADGSVPDLYADEGKHTIYLHNKRLKDPRLRLWVLAHELGHITARNNLKHRGGYLLRNLQGDIQNKFPGLARAATWIADNVPVIGGPIARGSWYGGRAMMESAANEEGLKHLETIKADKKMQEFAKKDSDRYIDDILYGRV